MFIAEPGHAFERVADSVVVLLAFVVCGGLVFELLRVVPEIWTAIATAVKRWTS